jgi:REP element-mobilizing transposase RayT
MRLAKLEFARIDRWLDGEPAVRHLADRRLAAVIRDSLYHFAGERYDLLAYVVMPSHLPWIFRPRDEWVAVADLGQRTSREAICHSVKRHSALVCNAALKLNGQFWQDESYDHWVRDAHELVRCIAYIESNPVKAGLCKRPDEWEFSSAFDRAACGLRSGDPLRPRRTG